MGKNLKEYITGKPLKELKKALMSGEQHPSCEYCWNNESTGLRSHRKTDFVESNKINSIF